MKLALYVPVPQCSWGVAIHEGLGSTLNFHFDSPVSGMIKKPMLCMKRNLPLKAVSLVWKASSLMEVLMPSACRYQRRSR